MKKGVLLTAVVMLSVVIPVLAAEGELSGSVDFTYSSRYIFRGIDVYKDNHSAIQPSINLDLFGTGFGANIWYSRANTSGYEEKSEIDYTLFYGNKLFEGEAYQMNYALGWTYFNYPKANRKTTAMQEVFGSVSMPDICPMGFVPSYTVISTWPSQGDSDLSDAASGWIHVIGLGYDLQDILPEQPIHLQADVVYNDGAYGVDNDWSHVLFGASTGFDLGNDLTFTPGIYYQISMEDTVNTSNEFWFSTSISYNF